MTRISERQLLHDLAGTSLDLAASAADPRLAGVPLDAADLDGDGRLAGAAEHHALFAVLDALDRDGRAATLASTPVMRARLEALATSSGSEALAARLAPPNDRVLHVGLTASGPGEAAALRRRAPVVAVESGDPVDRTVACRGRTWPFATAADVRAFVADLGLPAEQAEAVAQAIEQADRGGRGELARIAALWAPAERGADAPSRLVLSGHASGTGVHGDGGILSAAALGRLAAAMPRAARFVEDLHVAACYSGLPSKVAEWRAVFPSLRTFWGYDAFAPSGPAAVRHLAVWERATRGRSQALAPDAVRGAPRGDNVAVWTASAGHASSHGAVPLSVRQRDWERARAVVAAYALGDREVADPHAGELREAYVALQHLLGHSELPPAQARALEAERAFVFRLLFFRDSVVPRFVRAYGPELRAGFAALGAPLPELLDLGRGAALMLVAAVERAVAGLRPAPAAALRLRELLSEGLGALSPEIVPEHWVG